MRRCGAAEGEAGGGHVCLFAGRNHADAPPAARAGGDDCGGSTFTGARKGELRGFRWEDYDGAQIQISQSYWGSHRQEPKTRKSKAPVPVIGQLAERLNASRLAGESGERPDVPQPSRKPLNLDALAARCDSSDLTSTDSRGTAGTPSGAAWPRISIGWGCQDEIIQRILRHSTVASRKTATSRPRTPTQLPPCARSKMHLICTWESLRRPGMYKPLPTRTVSAYVE